jgi:hypothetical protein
METLPLMVVLACMSLIIILEIGGIHTLFSQGAELLVMPIGRAITMFNQIASDLFIYLRIQNIVDITNLNSRRTQHEKLH